MHRAGYINDICACTLTEDAQKRFAGNCDPVGIVVKIFPKEPMIKIRDIHKGIICSLIASNNLGPKLIYMDEECAINEYIQGVSHNFIEILILIILIYRAVIMDHKTMMTKSLYLK